MLAETTARDDRARRGTIAMTCSQSFPNVTDGRISHMRARRQSRVTIGDGMMNTRARIQKSLELTRRMPLEHHTGMIVVPHKPLPQVKSSCRFGVKSWRKPAWNAPPPPIV